LRIFLTNLRREGEEPVNINELDGGPIASARARFDEAAGIESSDFIPEEIDRLRPKVYEQLAAGANETLFFKVHAAYTYTADGWALLPLRATQGAIYLIRNPLDVAVALAHHFKELQRQEQDHGFRERPPEAERFFREEGWGAWRRELTPEQVARLIREHRKVMQRFGYLTEDGEPVFNGPTAPAKEEAA
jgi:hypothetical protein